MSRIVTWLPRRSEVGPARRGDVGATRVHQYLSTKGGGGHVTFDHVM